MFGKKKHSEDDFLQEQKDSAYVLEVEDLVVHYELENEVVEDDRLVQRYWIAL